MQGFPNTWVKRMKGQFTVLGFHLMRKLQSWMAPWGGVKPQWTWICWLRSDWMHWIRLSRFNFSRVGTRFPNLTEAFLNQIQDAKISTWRGDGCSKMILVSSYTSRDTGRNAQALKPVELFLTACWWKNIDVLRCEMDPLWSAVFIRHYLVNTAFLPWGSSSRVGSRSQSGCAQCLLPSLISRPDTAWRTSVTDNVISSKLFPWCLMGESSVFSVSTILFSVPLLVWTDTSYVLCHNSDRICTTQKREDVWPHWALFFPTLIPTEWQIFSNFSVFSNLQRLKTHCKYVLHQFDHWQAPWQILRKSPPLRAILDPPFWIRAQRNSSSIT